MPNGHGGSRLGSGQKRKPLADKMLDGNPGKRQLQVIEFKASADLQGLPIMQMGRTGPKNDRKPNQTEHGGSREPPFLCPEKDDSKG